MLNGKKLVLLSYNTFYVKKVKKEIYILIYVKSGYIMNLTDTYLERVF